MLELRGHVVEFFLQIWVFHWELSEGLEGLLGFLPLVLLCEPPG